ncbi:MAG: Nif3-like dinuclear metal center hexameric protein [Planctomycetes bacterium]|nr:Nif3-like dinuclear metal center hexameric protein [Planctomycetota bacterium]
MATVAGFVDILEGFAPLHQAAEWDNVGLLLGDPAAEVRRVLTCLTVTPESAAEAVAEGAQLVVTHHPILFRPVQRLTTTTAQGRMLLSLARAGVAVYSPHTAFDNTVGGINDTLARRLGLLDLAPLRRRGEVQSCKVVVFVPQADLGRVSDALFAAGAGHIGQYSQCSFRLAGTGTFFGSDATNPTVGQKGRREEVSEWRLEVICPQERVDSVVAAMRRAHSYEEPAYDVYPLRPALSATGEGRVGRLPRPTPLGELARAVKAGLNAGLVQLVGDASRPVERLALACGAGGEFLMDAVRAGAEALLTGEARFHDYLTARAEGLALILPGHYASERCGVEELAVRLQEHFADVQVWASRQEQDPVQGV